MNLNFISSRAWRVQPTRPILILWTLALSFTLMLSAGCSADGVLTSEENEPDASADFDASEDISGDPSDTADSDTSLEDSSSPAPETPDAGAPDAAPAEDISEDASAPTEPDAGDVEPPEEEDPEEIDDDYVLPDGTKFVWPAPGWITSNHFYPNGNEHGGSADIALPYWTDVGAARAGTVTVAKWGSVGGYYVHIDHGDGYKTVYSHLSEKPVVSAGDTVVTGQLLGYAGRTGNAFNGGSHLHFSITKDGDRQVVPDLEFGDWVSRGHKIEGTYAGLSALSDTGNRFFEVKAHEKADVRAEASGSSDVVATVAPGDKMTVTASKSGYYRVRHQGERGWIGHSATRPLKSELTSIKITAQNANVRDDPSMDGSVVGTIPNAKIVTIFKNDGNWKKLLFDLPTTYKWTHESNTAATEEFNTRIRSKNANIRTGPGTENNSVGLLPFYTNIHVLETRRGWYKIRHEGQTVWLAGWLTQGQI